MTKAELVALITHQTGVEKTAAEAVVEAFMRNIKETMIAGEDVFLRGFGSFIVKERAEKSGSQHHEEHDDGYSSPFHPRLQAIQSISGGSKRGNKKG